MSQQKTHIRLPQLDVPYILNLNHVFRKIPLLSYFQKRSLRLDHFLSKIPRRQDLTITNHKANHDLKYLTGEQLYLYQKDAVNQARDHHACIIFFRQ